MLAEQSLPMCDCGEMGKAARNRAKHRQEKELEQELEAAQGWMTELFGLKTANGFLELVERHPSLLSERVVDHAEQLGTVPAYGSLFAPVHRLLKAASDDPRAAWAVFASEQEAVEAQGRDLQSQQEQIDGAEAEGDLGRALRVDQRRASVGDRDRLWS